MFKIKIKEKKYHPYVGRTFVYKMDTIPKPYTVKEVKGDSITWEEPGTYYSSLNVLEEYLQSGDAEEVFLNKVN